MTAATLAPLSPAPGSARRARADLRRQVARLERVLATYPPAAAAPAPAADMRLPTLTTLEVTRDRLVAQLAAARERAAATARAHAAARERLDMILAAPHEHPYARVTLAELGLPGCGAYVVRPRPHLFTRLRDWWVVKLSSGCP